MNRDELKGKATKLKGRAKEEAGEITGDQRVQDEGAADQVKGEAQETWGRGKRRVGEAVEDVGDRMKE
jgi:uncharacterized protein YjbJ (UPF0337 family)